MSYSRTVESRPYDAYFDPVFTTPHNYVQSDPRVVASVSNTNAVSGSGRYRFFRRPIMPRISAIPPQILLAPTTTDDPLIPVEEEPEPPTKNAEIQTMYRESEAQTTPYTPEYVLEEGTDPEILMLKNLTYQNGLPVGHKELEMIEHARRKRDLENNMLPFTDEACFHVRKIMMEQQELKEYKLREIEVENQKNERLELLERTLQERDENIEFLSSQRIEAIRQTRMDIREKTLQKIRKKRINILRKLARKRNTVDPVLSTSTARDIINDYFDRGSDVYAPNRRDGQTKSSDKERYDITGRTAPLSILNNVEALDAAIPSHYTAVKSKAPPSHLGNDSPGESLMSKTAPALVGMMNGGRAAMPRLTSAATRTLRNTKKDIEIMHQILAKKKTLRTGEQSLQTPEGIVEERLLKSDSQALSEVGMETKELPSTVSTPGPTTARNLLLSRKPKGRPRTPDYTANKAQEPENSPLGRAVQNSMFEGRYRRRELINELRSVDEYNDLLQNDHNEKLRAKESNWNKKLDMVKESTVDTISGSVTSGLLVLMAQEKEREEYYRQIQIEADNILENRKKRELAEAGRRQRESVPDLQVYSIKVSQPNSDVSESLAKEEIHRIMTPVSTNFTDVVIATAAEKVAVNEVLNHLDNYPSLIHAFKNAESIEEQEQICRDLVQALSTPRPASRSSGLFSPEASVNNNDADATKEGLFQSLLTRLRSLLP